MSTPSATKKTKRSVVDMLTSAPSTLKRGNIVLKTKEGGDSKTRSNRRRELFSKEPPQKQAVDIVVEADTEADAETSPSKSKRKRVEDTAEVKAVTSSPAAKSAKKSSPPKSAKQKASLSSSSSSSSSSTGSPYYVQTAIHKVVDFRREGNSAGDGREDPDLLQVFAFLKQHCALPPDLQNNTQKYGPLSGVSFEERALSAYAHGLLDPSALSPTATELQPGLRKCFVESDFSAAMELIAEFTQASA